MSNIKNRYKALNPKEKASVEATYELIFLLRHDISEHDAVEFCKHMNGVIAANGGIIKKTEYWGLRQLAYRINKNTKAHYYFWQISSNKKLNIELGRVFGVSDKALRHSIIRVNEVLDVPSVMLSNLQEDITTGATVFNEKYIYNA